eukprot:891692-Amphidinium_carterae.2
MDHQNRLRLQHSLVKLNDAGAVICRVHGRTCLEEMAGFRNLANESQLDMYQLPTIIVFPGPGDTVDMLETTFEDEIQTLPKAVRKTILKQAPRWHAGDVLSSAIPPDLEILNFPQYEEAEEVMDEADDDEDTAEAAVEWTPSESERQAIQMAHNNLGHPKKADFTRLLRRGGARAEVVRWTQKHFECPACQHLQRPPPRLPAGAPKTFAMNVLVGIDCFEMTHPLSAINENFLHIVDWGTGRSWVRLFGHPATLVLDAGTEFQGVFGLACSQNGTLIQTIDTNTPWLNARTERCHAEIRAQVGYALELWTPVNDDEYMAIIYHCVNAVNMHSNRSGYSPVQRVLGYMPALPNSIVSDEEYPALIFEGPLEAVRRQEMIRDVAREAWAKNASRNRILAAARARHRGMREQFHLGQRVWIWRQPRAMGRGAWHGPGTVVSLTETGAYVSLRGTLLKVNSSNLRAQQGQDELADVMVGRFLSSLRTDASQEGLRRKRRYVNCIGEPPPSEAEEEHLPVKPGTSTTGAGQWRPDGTPPTPVEGLPPIHEEVEEPAEQLASCCRCPASE